MKFRCALVVFCLPAAAHANCYGGAGETLLSCTMNGGQSRATLCLQDSAAYYAFGPNNGAPDLLLARSVREVDMKPWPGIGRTYWEEAAFYNDGHEYRLTHGGDRDGEVEVPFAIVSVKRDGVEIANLDCDKGSYETGDFHPLYLAKEAAGQTWCHAASEWADTCE